MACPGGRDVSGLQMPSQTMDTAAPPIDGTAIAKLPTESQSWRRLAVSCTQSDTLMSDDEVIVCFYRMCCPGSGQYCYFVSSSLRRRRGVAFRGCHRGGTRPGSPVSQARLACLPERRLIGAGRRSCRSAGAAVSREAPPRTAPPIPCHPPGRGETWRGRRWLE